MGQLWAESKAKREVNKRKKATAATGEKKRHFDNGQIIVQLFSPEVEGIKGAKYARIGPREFVPFKNGDLTIENVKQACKARKG